MRDQDTSPRWARRAASPLVALALHALLGLVLCAIPLRPRAANEPPPAAAEQTIDLSLGEAAPAPLEEVPAGPGTPETQGDEIEARAAAPSMGATAASNAGRAADRSRTTRRTDPHADPASSRPETDRTGSSNDPQEPGGAVARNGPIALTAPRTTDLGIGGRNPFLPKSEAAVNAAESKRAVDHALRDPAREREQELGLGPEGPVLTALADGTARSVAPVRGRAVFIATSNADGEVVSLELADAEGGRPGWADAGRIALEGLKGKKLRVAPRTTRAVMRIEVVSTWKLPSGRDPGVDVTLFHIPISTKGEGKDSAKVSILDPIPKLHVHHIQIGGPAGAKIPIVTVEIDLLNFGIDPADLGARPRRVIHTHLLDSKVM
jgi:hypothetical protein